MQIAATTSQWGLVLEVFGAISLIVVVLFPLISAAKSWPAVRFLSPQFTSQSVPTVESNLLSEDWMGLSDLSTKD